jgi:hypothetical protein
MRSFVHLGDTISFKMMCDLSEFVNFEIINGRKMQRFLEADRKHFSCLKPGHRETESKKAISWRANVENTASKHSGPSCTQIFCVAARI